MATQNQNNLEEEIPPLTSISPSIFVPTDRDFTKTPPPLSDDPSTRLEARLEALDWHADRVEENMKAMLAREAERLRRAGQVERVQYDSYHRPIREPQRRMDDELLLEERILCEDEHAVRKILQEGKYRDNESTASSREDPRERRTSYRSRSPPPLSPRPRGPRDPEYADLATLRRDKTFRVDVDEMRNTPRTATLMYVLNLVKWGWDEQIEGHRAAVEREKEERRANLHLTMKENPFPLATTGPPAPAPLASALSASAPSHKPSVDDDPMDLD
ncbi:hypothetical protein F5Y10DRAFT_224850 [Nemania abortiva]|nr:hypothetical protein F5Y10DRAFT_224850 [Nemania abortiva]